MINRKNVAIGLAVGLLLSIGLTAGAFSSYVIDRYGVMQYTLTSTEGKASITCYSNNVYVALLWFLKDGTPIKQNRVSGGNSILYYSYDQYSDILAMLEKGNAKLYQDPTHPESAYISSSG
jgi:hypothetical protein